VTVAVTVLGPSGRMGQAILNAAAGRADVRIAAALDRSDARRGSARRSRPR
jgi:dihydrodipicolinate reductase